MRARHLLIIAPIVLAAGCSSGGDPTTTGRLAGVESSIGPERTESGTFGSYRPGATAVTYDARLVPPGATAQVSFARSGDGDAVRLTVTGMVPRRSYGAHLHTGSCAGRPDAAGPHYQHRADPSKPSVDPEFANPDNEVWLDFTADAEGAASAESRQEWTFDETNPPRSLVLHAESTRTEEGEAGTAGPRAACLTLSGS